MNQPIALSNAAHLTQLSTGLRLLKQLAGNFALEATLKGRATLSIDETLMLFAGVDSIAQLAKRALAVEVERLSPNPAPTQEEVAAPQPVPSMTKGEFIKSWSEPRDTAGLAELKDMADEPARLPPGVFVLKGSPDEIQKQVAELLQGVFRRPSTH